MNKNLELDVDLQTYLQEEFLPKIDKNYQGTLTKKEEGLYSFIESATQSRRRKPSFHIHDGDYVTMVLRRDGHLQVSVCNFGLPSDALKKFDDIKNDLKKGFKQASLYES